jgi:DNA-binding GntR family transcriptional regulator
LPAETTPRYLEIADYLRRLVAEGRAGDRLPSDAELCHRFGVSRMTARQAVQVLAVEHLLTRRRGDGTFIAEKPAARTLGSPLSFTESMRRRGIRASSRVLLFSWREPSDGDRAALRLEPEEEVIRLERLRLADGRPMAIERASIAPSLAAILEVNLERGSLHAAFEQLGRIPALAEARVSARRATAVERRALQLGPAGVVLIERRVIRDQEGLPMEHTETVYAAERYEFEAVLHQDAERGS